MFILSLQVGNFLRQLVEWKRSSCSHKQQILKNELQGFDTDPEFGQGVNQRRYPLMKIGNSTLFHNLIVLGTRKSKQILSLFALFYFFFKKGRCFLFLSHVCIGRCFMPQCQNGTLTLLLSMYLLFLSTVDNVM